MRDYTPEELQQVEQDVEALSRFWERFKYDYHNTPTGGLHAPPIIVQCSVNLLDEIMGIVPESFEDENVFRGLVNIASVMFQFGQYTAKGGLYDSNMQQCICCQVDDSALKEVLSDDPKR